MKALRLVLLGIALMVMAGLGWRFRHPEARVPSPVAVATPGANRPEPPAGNTAPPSPADARRLVLSRMADAPDYAPFFDRFREGFPTDYTALVDAASETVAQGGHVANPDRLLIDALRRLRQTRGVLAAQAEAGPLIGIFEAQAALLDMLAPDDPALCVDFLYGGISPNFMAFAAKHREAVERLAIANLSAIASGKASRVERVDPTNEDFDTLTARLKGQGLSDDEVSAVLDGKTFDPPLPEQKLCNAGRAYLQALAAMPEEARLRIYALSAALVARS